MTHALGFAALLITAAGLLAAGLVLLRSRDPAVGIGVLLEFLLAAGLLRLAAAMSLETVLTLAVIVALRRLLVFGLRTGGRARAG